MHPTIDKVTIKQIAEFISGTVNNNTFSESVITGIKPLHMALKDDITFFAPTSKRMHSQLHEIATNSDAGAILVKEFSQNIKAPQIQIDNPLSAIISLVPLFYKAPRPAVGIHPSAVIGERVQIGKNVAIGAFVSIGDDVTIGDDTAIFSHVVIYSGASVGRDCVIHAHAVIREFVCLGSDCVIQNGAVVGGDGFGYLSDMKVGHMRIPHIGNVVFEDKVDLGANTTVDRATLGETRIGYGTKLDNLVMIGHNCNIGKHNLFCAQVGMSGSCTVGNFVVLGGKVGVADHTVIGDNVRAAALSGARGTIPPNLEIAGHPWQEATAWRRAMTCVQKLPEFFKKNKNLFKQ